MVAKETGWSKKEIIHQSFAALQLMIADAPKSQRKKEKKKEEFESDADLINWLGAEQIE